VAAEYVFFGGGCIRKGQFPHVEVRTEGGAAAEHVLFTYPLGHI
jgi:hypothetical protein